MPKGQSGSSSGLAAHTSSDTARRGAGGPGGPPPPPPTTTKETQTYRVSFPKHLSLLRLPVAGCLGGASSRTNLQIHFVHCYVWDTIMILEEGNGSYPRCPQCDMFMPQKSLNSRNLVT